METIAVTNWNEIVSPLYDSSCSLLFVRADQSRLSLDVRSMSITEKADACRTHGAAVLICGAISSVAYAALTDRGIKVHSWIRGPVADVIEAYRRNKGNIGEMFAMPGCGRARGGCAKRRRLRRGGTHGCRLSQV
jgi:hypothetical protein